MEDPFFKGLAEGLVTNEDIMEDVFEEKEDEYDAEEKPQEWMRRISDREYIVSARIKLDNLQEELGLVLPRGEYATLAEFLLEKAREIPPVGTTIKKRNISFTIHRCTPQEIQEVRVSW